LIVSRKKYSSASSQIHLVQGDITKAETGAIVNAANSGLRGGGGVDGAIHRAAGPELLEAGRRIVQEQGRLETGQAVITPGFNLPAGSVIHTVGPVWRGGHESEDELLAAAYANSLRLAEENGLTSLAFPAISCGVFGFPVERAAEVALTALRDGLAQSKLSLVEIYLMADEDFAAFERAAEKVLERSF
jgi:O-acetyl-ADP-ribose deacetylase (regulator of RNase III)